MHAVAAIRAEPPAAAGGDVYAAVGAFLTRHALGAHPANYAFAFYHTKFTIAIIYFPIAL